MKTLVLTVVLGLTFFSGFARAIPVSNKEELKGLPSFCKGTQLIRDISGDTTPYSTYLQMYGADFQHLHHYCWALNTENKFRRKPSLYFGYLSEAIGDLNYVLSQSKDPNFIFIPEVHLAKARIYLLLKQKEKAVASAYEAIAKKPNYVSAYTYLSDLYEDSGNKANAIKVLKSGLEHEPDAKPILRRLIRLGVTPPKPPMNSNHPSEAPAITAAPALQPGEVPKTLENESQGAPISQPIQPSQTETAQPPPNPYCRFCP